MQSLSGWDPVMIPAPLEYHYYISFSGHFVQPPGGWQAAPRLVCSVTYTLMLSVMKLYSVDSKWTIGDSRCSITYCLITLFLPQPLLTNTMQHTVSMDLLLNLVVALRVSVDAWGILVALQTSSLKGPWFSVQYALLKLDSQTWRSRWCWTSNSLLFCYILINDLKQLCANGFYQHHPKFGVVVPV